VTFIDSPRDAAIVLIFIVVYQQIENYLFAPRITARTMELHAAVAFGAALGGGAILGPVGAVLALPAAAMVQALASNVGPRYSIVDSHLTTVMSPAEHKHRRRLERRLGRGDRDEVAGDASPPTAGGKPADEPT
jgi:hypothetical protein